MSESETDAASAAELRERLSSIEDPIVGTDIVSMGLVNDVAVEDGTASISLAFNSPFAPAEMELGDRIREVVAETGLEADLRAHAGSEHGFDEEVLPTVRNVIAVASGKGGVGKTTVATNLAAGLDELGARVGVLDADIHGPNVPRLLPLEGEPAVTQEDKLVPPVSEGVRVMSMGFLLKDQDDPAILRGPMVNKFMMKFVDGVEWGHLDYLVVDLPPGTGDASLNLLQAMPVAGAVLVTTPQQMSVDDTRKAVQMFQQHDAPVLGVVENMSSFRCPSCGDSHELFGRDGAVKISEDYDVPRLDSLPLHPDFGGEDIGGTVVKDAGSEIQGEVLELIEAIADRIGEENRRKVALRRGSLEEESPPPADG